MPKQNIINTNFTSGEVSPLVRGRVDAQKYGNGLETCENFIVRPQGPIWRRSGSQYLGPIKLPTSKAILVPFEYSDAQGYVLEFGRGYIHFWKNGGKLFETTTQEVESFNTWNNGGLIQIGADFDKLAIFGYDGITTGDGTVKVSENKDGKLRITTSIPHTLRSGAIVAASATEHGVITGAANNGSGKVRITSTAHGLINGTVVSISGVLGTVEANGTWTISNVATNTFDLGAVNFVNAYTGGGVWDKVPTLLKNNSITRINNFTFDITGVSAGKYVDGKCAIFTSGVLSGDRIYISGATDIPELTERFAIVQSLDGLDVTLTQDLFTTNIPRITNDSNPQQEEAWTIPIEISTDYGYYPSKSIQSITSSLGTILVTIPNHGYVSGDEIDIYGTGNSADGRWVADVVSSSTFKLTGSVWKADASIGYARKYIDSLESELRQLKFVQSADVLYVMHPLHPVYKLTRLSNDGDRNDWLFAQVDFKDGPYLPLNSLAPTWDEATPANGSRFADVYFELSNYLHTATVKSATAFAAGTPSTDVGKYFEYKEGDQWRLAKVYTGFAGGATSGTVEIIDNVLLHLDESIKYKLATKYKVPLLGNVSVVSNAGSPNMTPSLPGAGVRKRIDPNNYIYGDGIIADKTLTSNFSNTFGTSDLGKYVRYFHFDSAATPKLKPYWSRINKIVDTKPGTQCLIDAAVTMTANNSTGNFEITNHSRTATLKAYKNGAAFSAFNATDVGRHVRIGWAGRWTWGKITAFTSASEVSVSLYEDVPRDPHNASNLAGATNGATDSASTTGRSYDWRMGAWSETTGYPSCGVFHEQRLWFGKTSTEPQTLWASVAGDFENFSPTEFDSTVLEDNAIGFTIASTKANPIKWMVSGPAITVGTTGGEWQVKSSSVASEPITPLNIVVVPHTSHGSHSSVQPIRIGNSILFADRPGNRVRELVYDFSVDALISRDLTYLSEHMLRESSGAIYSAYQQEPNNICWYVLSDGTLAAVTINKDQEIVAWHHHTIAEATVESIAVIPSTDSSKDNVYMVVKRGSNRYVELLQDDFYPNGSNRKGMRYLDGAVVFSGTDFSGTKVAGLHHLEGKTVTVSIDGTLLGTYTVSGGIATIASQSGKELVVGLPYTSTAKSLPPEGGSAFGVSQGKIKKLAKYNVRLLNSLAMDYGFNSNGQSLNSITNLHENGTSTDFYTGTKELIPNNPYDAESQWTLLTNKPYALNVLSVTLTVETGE